MTWLEQEGWRYSTAQRRIEAYELSQAYQLRGSTFRQCLVEQGYSVQGRSRSYNIDKVWRKPTSCQQRTHPQKKSAAGKLLREFCLGSIFDFFNRIGHQRASGPCHILVRSKPDCVAKSPKRCAAKFPLNDKTSGNRRSM
jgi:hypothetical protein